MCSKNCDENGADFVDFFAYAKSKCNSFVDFFAYANQNANFAGGFEHQGYFALIDKDGYIRSRKDNFGNPIMYYLGINDINANLQGIDMLSYDIKKLINE